MMKTNGNNGNNGSNGKRNGLAVVTGRRRGARRFLIYGPESVGKTTLAAHAPAPIFIDIEDGSAELDVARFEFGDDGDVVPPNYQSVLDAVSSLGTAEHGYKTLVIDSLDRLEALIWAHVLERDSGRSSNLNKGGKALTSIEAYGYGKGYGVALDEFRALLETLDRLRKKTGMNIVFIGHTHVKLFKNPEGEDYDRYWLRVHGSMAGQSKEWVDVLGFACFDEGGGKLDPQQRKAKGWSTGRRLLKLCRQAAFDAKSRIAMPNQIELNAENPWAPLAAAMELGQSMEPADLLLAIKTECERVNDEALTANVRTACKGTRDTAKLSRYLMELKNRTPKAEETTNV